MLIPEEKEKLEEFAQHVRGGGDVKSAFLGGYLIGLVLKLDKENDVLRHRPVMSEARPMHLFCKVFEVATGQVLVAKVFADDDDEEHEAYLTVTTYIDSVKVDMTYKYSSEQVRDEEFDSYDQNQADGFRSNIVRFYGANT